MKIILSALSICAVGLSLHAVDSVDYSTWIYQINSDTNSQPSSTAGYSFAGGTFWSDGEKPAAGNSYYVPNAITNMSSNKMAQDSFYSFLGDALAVAGIFDMRTGSRKNVVYKELHFLDGALGLWSSVGSLMGHIKIVSSEISPAIWRFVYSPSDNKTYTVSVKSDVSGAEGSCVRMERAASTSKVKLTWSFPGDWSEFFGTLLIADTMSTVFDELKTLDFPGFLGAADGYVLKIGEHACPNYSAHAGGILSIASASGEVKAGKMKLKSGGELKMACIDGATAVLALDSLDVEPGAKLNLEGLTLNDVTAGDKPMVIPVFRFAADAVVPDVSGLEILPKVAGSLPHYSFTNIVDESGRTDICATWKKVVTKIDDDGSDNDSFSEANVEWSDGVPVSAGKDYLCMKKTSISSGSVSFRGDSLSLGDTFFYFKGSTFTASDLHFLPGLILDIYANDRTKIIDGGTLTIHSGVDDPPRIRFFQGRELRVDSEIVGSGTLKLHNKTNEKEPSGIFIPAALNTNYHGRVILQTYPQTASENIPQAPDASTDKCTCMIIADERNLGGEFTADENVYSAITIIGQSLVSVTNSVTFSDPTRGIFIDNAARFRVSAGKTLTFKNTLTLGGELWKEGDGELLLDGRVQFYGGEILQDPVAGTNVVRVKAGSVRVGSVESADGVDFIFSQGAYLVADASDNASGFGLCLKKSGSALRADAEDAKIAVTVTGYAQDADSIVCAIVTAASTAEANAMAAKLHVRRPTGFGTPKLSVRTNDDGSATVMATIYRSGFSVIVR